MWLGVGNYCNCCCGLNFYVAIVNNVVDLIIGLQLLQTYGIALMHASALK